VLAEGPSIGPAELELEAPNGIRPEASTISEAKEELEKEILANALRENKGNISRTAKALGISRSTLYDLISRYGL
jgi:two-component system NtrC family response regulator